MTENKFRGFTLSETLITLTVIGIAAVLVIPSLIRNTTNKSRIALLQNTVSNIGNMVQSEMARERAQSVNDFLSDTQDFLEKFDTVINGKSFASSYAAINSNTSYSPEMDASVQLKNGTGLGIILDEDDDFSYYTIVIDVNGIEAPNKIGIDYFELKLYYDNDFVEGIHSGDIGSFTMDDLGLEKLSEVYSTCLAGGADGAKACYKLVELSGFDPEYLEKDYSDD